MNTKIRVLWFGLMMTLAGSAYAALPLQVGGRPVTSLAPLVEATSPAVVNIRVRQTVSTRSPYADDAMRRFFGLPDSRGGDRQIQSAGSGVIVNAAEGYILTNHHVVANADEILITLLDGELLDAEIIGSDAETDIAVLKVDADDLVDMPIGDSTQVRVGDFVIAIGNPFGLGHTVTSGIVSALGRTGIGAGLEDFIQTDASINPGNSGGALVNMDGELVGMPVSASDLPYLALLFGDDEVGKTLGGTRSYDEVIAIYSRWREVWDERQCGPFVFRISGDTFVGYAGVVPAPIGDPGDIELLYGISPSFWGRGITTRMSRLVAHWAFEQRNFDSLVAYTLQTNLASMGVMKNLGFSYQRDVEKAGLTHVFYRLTRQSWRAATTYPRPE